MRRPLPNQATLRHEIVCTLLQVVMKHPAASSAHEVCVAVQSSAAHGRVLVAQQLAEREANVVHWVGLAKTTLQATAVSGGA